MKVYYRRGMVGWESDSIGIPLLTKENLKDSHVMVKEVQKISLDEAFFEMQGENWSPNGEANDLLRSLGLTHTSMSIGDAVVDNDGLLWECMGTGWRLAE